MTQPLPAHLLAEAHRGGARVRWRDVLPEDRAGAYAIQDATLARLGPIGGWKVGSKGPKAETACAPLPASGLLASGVTLVGDAWRMRGVEVEVALRLGRDLDASDALLSPAELAAAVDAVLPVIEVVETRLADWAGSDALAQLADLQSHGALVMGATSTFSPAELDLRTVQAHLSFNGQVAAHTTGGNPAADLWRMFAWLARHCAQRGQPLRAGQMVTTGSCTGMLFAPQGAFVVAELHGIGRVELQL